MIQTPEGNEIRKVDDESLELVTKIKITKKRLLKQKEYFEYELAKINKRLELFEDKD